MPDGFPVRVRSDRGATDHLPAGSYLAGDPKNVAQADGRTMGSIHPGDPGMPWVSSSDRSSGLYGLPG